MTDEADDELLRRVTAALRDRGAASAGFDARVMSAIRSARRPPLGTLLAWFTEPQPLAVSPLGMLAGAAAVVALLAGTAAFASRVRLPASVAARAAEGRPPAPAVVRFVYAAPAANSVALIGSFNNWNPQATPLYRADGTGIWVVDVPLPPGRHEYGFLINGHEWRPDPAAPHGGANEFGFPNSVVLVPMRQS